MKNALQIRSAVIIASKHSDDEVYFETDISGILPGCRKNVKLSLSPYALQINFRPLFGHNGSASIDPQDWKLFVSNLPVVSSDLFPVQITPEIVAQGRAHAERLCDCPAVTSEKFRHPDYKPSYHALKVSGYQPVLSRKVAKS